MTDPRYRQQPWDSRLTDAIGNFLARRGWERPGESLVGGIGGGLRSLDEMVAQSALGQIGVNPNAPLPPPPGAMAGPVSSPFMATPPSPIPSPFADPMMGPPAGAPPPMPSPPMPPAPSPPMPPVSLGGPTDASMGGATPPYFGNVAGGGSQNMLPPPSMPSMMAGPTDASMGPNSLPTDPAQRAILDRALNRMAFPEQAAPQAPGRSQGPPQMSQEPMGPPDPMMSMLPEGGPPTAPPDGPMSMAPPGGSFDPAARAAMLQIFPPQGSPFAGERSIESYFSESEAQKLLKQARRDMISQALIGFGAGMLGGEDLSGGLSAGFANVQKPLGEYQEQRRDIPRQFAEGRFKIEGEREERGLSRDEARRRERLAGIEEGQFELEKEVQPYKIRQYEQALERGTLEIQIERDLAPLRKKAIEIGNQQARASIDKIYDDIRQGKLLEPFEIASRVQLINESMSRTSENYAQARGGTTGVKGQLTEAGAMKAQRDMYAELQRSGMINPEWNPDQQRAFVLRTMVERYGHLDPQSIQRMGLGDAAAIVAAHRQGRLQEIANEPEVQSDPALQALIEMLNAGGL